MFLVKTSYGCRIDLLTEDRVSVRGQTVPTSSCFLKLSMYILRGFVFWNLGDAFLGVFWNEIPLSFIKTSYTRNINELATKPFGDGRIRFLP